MEEVIISLTKYRSKRIKLRRVITIFRRKILFGLVSLFNGKSTFVGYLIRKISLKKALFKWHYLRFLCLMAYQAYWAI